MKIGIDASRAFLPGRTGTGGYSYEVIRHLRRFLPEAEVVLYTRPGRTPDFDLPAAWSVKTLRSPIFWTLGRLSFEMLFHPPDALFIPSHVVPLVRPRRTVVTVHGLEYEASPGSYPFAERAYLRVATRWSCRSAERIVAVSESTKRDLSDLYGVPKRKIRTIYEGKPDAAPESRNGRSEEEPYILFIGRLEARKNVRTLVSAFDILKRSGLPHRLVLVGSPGYGYGNIRRAIAESPFRKDIVETGYADEEKKRHLLASAAVLTFPSLYEGFGLPVVEAQAAGIPVVTSKISSLPEIGGDGAAYADPESVLSVADGIRRVVSDPEFRDDILWKGFANAERFDWDRTASEIAAILLRNG